MLFLEKLLKRNINTILYNLNDSAVKNQLLGIFKLSVHLFRCLLLSFLVSIICKNIKKEELFNKSSASSAIIEVE